MAAFKSKQSCFGIGWCCRCQSKCKTSLVWFTSKQCEAASRSIYGNLWVWKCLNVKIQKHSSPPEFYSCWSGNLNCRNYAELPWTPLSYRAHQQWATFRWAASLTVPLTVPPHPPRWLKPSAPAGNVVKPSDQPPPPPSWLIHPHQPLTSGEPLPQPTPHKQTYSEHVKVNV